MSIVKRSPPFADTTDKKKSDNIRTFVRLNIVLALIVALAASADTHSATQLTALVGSVWLAMLLVVPRLLGIQFLAQWQATLSSVLPLRKYLGLWAAAWFGTHAALAIWIYFGTPEQFFASIPDRPTLILEIIGLGIMLLLTLLSNAWSFKHVPGWKQIQMMVWMIPGMALPSSWIAAETFLGQKPLLLIAPVLLSLCIVTGLATNFFASRSANDWLRLGFLCLGMGISLVTILI